MRKPLRMNMVDDPWTTGLLLAGYLLAMTAVGARAARRSKTVEGFFLAERGLAPAALAATLAATILGASSTLGMAGLGFREGLTGAWWLLSGTAGLLVLSLFLAEKVRETGCFTLPELLGATYDRRVRVAASALILASWVGIIAAQIVASGKLLGILFGPRQEVFIVASALVFVGYTALGGQRSIVKTDAVQLLILLLGLALVSWRAFQLAGPDLLAGQSFPTSEARGWPEVTSLLLVVGSAYLVGPDIYSRLFSASDPGTARRASLAAALILVPLAFVITSLGIAARLLFPAILPEEALPVLMAETLSPLGAGIVAAALLSALLSSADTTLLTATSILALDLFRAARPHASAEEILWVSRAGCLLIGGVALVSALRLPEIVSTLLAAYTIFAGGLIVPAVAGFQRDRLRLTPSGALASILGGGAVALLFGGRWPLLGMATSAFLLIAVSWLLPQSKRRISG